jgi:hypothetical protein
MSAFLFVGLGGGLIFLLLDFLLNVNPLARRLSQPYAPIARAQLPIVPAAAIDLLLGVAMAGVFLLIRPAFPGGTVLGLGIAFGLLAWFFRVLMGALSQWVMFVIPVRTHLYSVAAGLLEMVILGIFFAAAFDAVY